MTALRSQQARHLRRRLFARMAAATVAYVAAFLVLAVALDAAVLPQLGEQTAERLAPWSYLTSEEYSAMLESHGIGLDGSTPIDSSYYEDWQVIIQPDGTYAVRNLQAYNLLKSLKIPVAVALFLSGLALIEFAALNRTLRYFDELATAAGGLLENRSKPVKLPPDLSIAQADLEEVRQRSLADERASRAAEQRKNELVAYLAHDIKTPLTSVTGYLALLAESPDLPAEQRARYAGVALEKAERLEGLMDEFFEITRYNLQAIPIERERIGLALLCQQVADELFPAAAERSVGIRVEAPQDARVFADPEKLARALGNVVRNAVAFADAGSDVRIEARLEAGPSAAGAPTAASSGAATASAASSDAADPALRTAAIRVIDRGREISPAHLQRIFEKFYREDAARQSGTGGAGLGLAIAREIMRAHGGDISAASAEGETTFVLTFPTRTWPENASTHEDASAFPAPDPARRVG